jgi:SAM-dependent methyltransferase
VSAHSRTSAPSTPAEPRRGVALDDCNFYHSIDLPISGPQKGAWDLRGRFDDYIGHQNLDGRTVLDVGAATGFLSFEAERRGARVTSFDVSSPDLLVHLPIPGGEFADDYPAFWAKADLWVRQVKNSYWLCHEELHSSAVCVYGDIYGLDRSQQFDVVMVGQLLVHLRDALSALAAAARVCRETLIVVEGNLPEAAPIASLCGRPEIPYAWYHYSHGWYREVLSMLGFADVEISVQSYVCNDALHSQKIELATVVASR